MPMIFKLDLLSPDLHVLSKFEVATSDFKQVKVAIRNLKSFRFCTCPVELPIFLNSNKTQTPNQNSFIYLFIIYLFFYFMGL